MFRNTEGVHEIRKERRRKRLKSKKRGVERADNKRTKKTGGDSKVLTKKRARGKRCVG